MRFAYIDSQGKEVSIPSVEALQLRIELGAITEGTRFYDASTDRWAPAGEHEIFRTLSRESGDRDQGGFVAPPPPTRGQKRPGAPPPGPEPAEGGDAREPSPDRPGEAAEPPSESAEPPGEKAAGAEPQTPPSRPRDPDPFEREQGPAEDEPSLDSFDLDVPEGEAGGGLEPPPGEPSTRGPARDEPSADEPSAADEFDFEGFGTIELDDSFTAPRDEEAATDAEEDAAEDEGEAAEAAEVSGQGDTDTFVADDLDLEPPLSEQPASSFAKEDDEATVAPDEATDEPARDTSDEVPAWMREDAHVEEDEEAVAAPDTPPRDQVGRDRGSRERTGRAPTPPPRRGESDGDRRDGSGRGRTRPTPPPRRGKESKVGRIAAGVVAGIALVAVGWYLLTLFGGGEPTVEVVEPAVEIPELPSELVATWEATGPAAYAATLDSLRALGSELPEAPPEAWLGGNYLANASRFPGVRDYWGAVRRYLDRIRGTGEELFLSLYEAELDSAGVGPGGHRDALIDRARAGFQASGPDREVIYGQLEGLIDAAEGLDDFLRENEASIDYEPAAGGISRDPVVEAVPATEAMGEEMWDRVARITAAMDALGAVDRVRSELLLDILFEKLRRTTLY